MYLNIYHQLNFKGKVVKQGFDKNQVLEVDIGALTTEEVTALKVELAFMIGTNGNSNMMFKASMLEIIPALEDLCSTMRYVETKYLLINY